MKFPFKILIMRSFKTTDKSDKWKVHDEVTLETNIIKLLGKQFDCYTSAESDWY